MFCFCLEWWFLTEIAFRHWCLVTTDIWEGIICDKSHLWTAEYAMLADDRRSYEATNPGLCSTLRCFREHEKWGISLISLIWFPTIGAFPYPGVQNREIMEFLVAGFRLEKPKICPEELYACLIKKKKLKIKKKKQRKNPLRPTHQQREGWGTDPRHQLTDRFTETSPGLKDEGELQ